MDQFGAETVNLAAVHFDFARNPCPHAAERIDRDRLFVRERELCHAAIFGGSAAGGNDTALKTLFANCLQHRLGRDLVRVVADVEQVLGKIHLDATDPRKP